MPPPTIGEGMATFTEEKPEGSRIVRSPGLNTLSICVPTVTAGKSVWGRRRRRFRDGFECERRVTEEGWRRGWGRGGVGGDDFHGSEARGEQNREAP